MFQKRDAPSATPWWPSRSRSAHASPIVTADAAFRQSAVWAALQLRANLISSFPIDAFRLGGGIQIEVTKPPVLTSPSPQLLSMREWMYSTQIDLDRYGNCFGLIRELDGNGKPRRIDLLAQSDVTVKIEKGEVVYRVKGKVTPTEQIWHERQYTVPGLPVGLSPIAYAAWSLSTWQSAAEFALEWFGNHGITPNAHLKNVGKTLADGEADKVKERFKVAVEGGDVFVTGKDWEFSTINAATADAQFLAAQENADAAAARFLGVPGDLIDVATKGQSITYANITQRNLQLLIMHLGGAVARREDALSTLLPAPRFVKLNTAAILRMDPETTSRILTSEVAGKITAPSEARALMNRQPFTPDQLAEFEALGITHQLPPAPLAPQIGGSK
ncbi:phage portal protein [Microbacterium xylanilyticum]